MDEYHPCLKLNTKTFKVLNIWNLIQILSCKVFRKILAFIFRWVILSKYHIPFTFFNLKSPKYIFYIVEETNRELYIDFFLSFGMGVKLRQKNHNAKKIVTNALQMVKLIFRTLDPQWN